MKINKEGYKIIGITGLICLLLGTGIYRLLSSHDNGTLVWVLVVLMLLFWFFIVAFFREPRRVKYMTPIWSSPPATAVWS